MSLTPITRKEAFLAAAGGQAVSLPDPVTREEMFLAKIAGGNVQIPDPVTRYEIFLAKSAGMDINLPVPITRREMFIAIANGAQISLTPITREEIFWSEIRISGEAEIEGNPIVFRAKAGNPIAGTLTIPVTQESGEISADTPKNIFASNSIKLALNGSDLSAIVITPDRNTFAAGTIDLITGNVTITHECIICDGTETIGTAGSPVYDVIKIGPENYGVASSAANPNYCSHLEYSGSTSSQNIQAFRFLSSTTYDDYRVIFRINNINPGNTANIRSYFAAQKEAGTPVQFCYKLTTPKVLTVSVPAINLVAGQNTMSAPAGTIWLKYEV